VLLLTGAFEPIDEHRARSVGCDGVLVKPFEPQMVINRVKDLLAGKKADKPASSAHATPDQPPTVAAGQESYVPRAANQGDSLEDYFDRLDAAFATLSNEPAASASHPVVVPPAPQTAVAAQSSAVDVATWDPDLTGRLFQPTVQAPIPVVQTPASMPSPDRPPAHTGSPRGEREALAPPAPLPVAPVTAGSAASTASPPPAQPAPVSLAEAFATLLAAEHGQTSAPIPLQTVSAAPDVVDDIVQRVLDRLHQEDMRRTVLDVAERLVREEIDRIKRTNG